MLNKKHLSIWLAVVLILGTVFPVAAQTRDEVAIISSRVVKCAHTGSFISEQVDEHHRVIRTFERAGNIHKRGFTDAHAEARATLLMLGMRPYNIGRLSPEQLEFIASSPRIQAIASYTKTDTYGNTIFVEPTAAYAAAERANKAELEALDYLLQQSSSPDALVDNQPLTVGYFNDGIMSLIHIAVASASDPARYTFITDALWLQMPWSRRTDSVGSVASSIAVDFSSMGGWYSYQRRSVVGANITYHFYSRTATTQHRISGAWQGTAAIVNMPLDTTVTRPIFVMHRHSNLNAVNVFEGLMVHPQLITNFNSIGAHYHSGFGIGAITPIVSISFGVGGVAASIGLAPTWHVVTTRRHVPLLLTYRP